MTLRPLLAALGAALLAVSAIGATPEPAPSDPRPAQAALDDLESVAPARVGPRPRATTPEDRYALAGGCYAVRSLDRHGLVTRTENGFAATASEIADAEPFHFRAYDLGKYLLFGSNADFFAAAAGPAEQFEDGAEPVEGRLPVTPDTDLPRALHGDAPRSPDGSPLPALPDTRGSAVVAAPQPSVAAEWVVKAVDGGGFTLQLPVDDGAEEDPGPVDPDIAKTLTVADDGTLQLVDGSEVTDAATFGFVLTEGCAEWPEVDINVSGEQPRGDTPYEETRGYLDAHLHMMAFEFLGGRARCGRPWHPYGVTHALVDCEHHKEGGAGFALEFALSGTGPHDTTGWPTFGYWPRYDSYTHEQVYYRWLERAWRGGLRMFTNLLVENSVLCEVYPYKENSCNDMDGVRLQAQRLRELERYIDAQSGGPGEGWFRIVTDPFQARRVINAGKLAVVMGIEVSALFDCVEYLGVPQCTLEDIDRQLEEAHDLGVRQMELVNKFDNAFSGVAGDGGTTGVLVNAGNRYETGHFWPMQTCVEPEGHEHHSHDKTQYNLSDDADTTPITGHDALAGGIMHLFGTSGVAPVYPQGPHCNSIGLTDHGRYLIDRMIQKGMLFDPDHMSAKARREALDHLAARGYSGVVSSHSWADDVSYKRIWEMGGVVTPMSKSSESFVEQWRTQRDWADPRFYFGLGYGADTNGFASQGGPRNPDEANDVDYPFTGFGGVSVDQQVSGEQVYDVNTDGVDHYGLYPDWVEDVAILAGDEREQFLEDMARGPEAYLQMWERAVGVAPDGCRPDVDELSRDEVEGLRRGMTPEQVLLAAGQPRSRVDRAFTYCGEDGGVTVTFGEDATLQRVTVDRSRTDQSGSRAGARSNEGGAAHPAAPDDVAHDHSTHDHPPTAMREAATARETGLRIGVLLLGLAGVVAMRLSRRRT